jgi:hypothetical protein
MRRVVNKLLWLKFIFLNYYYATNVKESAARKMPKQQRFKKGTAVKGDKMIKQR